MLQAHLAHGPEHAGRDLGLAAFDTAGGVLAGGGGDHAVVAALAAGGEPGPYTAIVVLQAGEIAVDQGGQLLAAQPPGLGLGLGKRWVMGVGGRVAVLRRAALAASHGLDLGDPAARGADAHRQEAGLAVLLHRSDPGDLAGAGIGRLDGRLRAGGDRAPERVGDHHRHAVLGIAHGRRPGRSVRPMGDHGVEIGVGGAGQAGRIAGRSLRMDGGGRGLGRRRGGYGGQGDQHGTHGVSHHRSPRWLASGCDHGLCME